MACPGARLLARLGLKPLNRAALGQLIRYGVVGLVQNGLGYGLYIFLTWLGLDPKLVVGVCYPVAAFVSFMGNKKYTFTYAGGLTGAGLRFILAHVVSYGINLALLAVLVDRLGYAHQWVQLTAIFVCAVFLFLALKFFVFAGRSAEKTS